MATIMDLFRDAAGEDPANFGYQDDGSYRLNTNVSDDQAERMAGRVSREQFERYMEDFAPQEREMIGSLDANTAQDQAKKAGLQAKRSRAALERMRERYGSSLTEGQQKAEGNQFQRDKTVGKLSALNTGRQLDEDRSFNMKGSMLNIGNNLSSSATQGLTQSAQNASAREQSYQQAKAQHEAQQAQQTASTIGTLGTIAAIAF